MSSLSSRNKFKKWIESSIDMVNARIPLESSLWPGYTPLHLAVLFARRFNNNEVDFQIIRLCLKKGADLSLQDSRGRTALHLAYRLDKIQIVELLLHHRQRIPNLMDEDDLSHLHVVCAVNPTARTFKKCAFDNSEVNLAYKGTSPVNNVRPGSTPLHVCQASLRGKDEPDRILKILLKNGADPHAKDAYGLTPIHWLLNNHSRFSSQLLKPKTIDCLVEEYGLSYLHVACHLNDFDTAKHLLDQGADVNLAIKYRKRSDDDPLSFLSNGCTPVHLSSFGAFNLQVLLLENGANVFAERGDGWVPLNSSYLNPFMRKLWDDVGLQRRMKQEFGWTRLHLACYLLKDDGFEDVVRTELVDINARVKSSSPVWKGYTPAHLLMNRSKSLDMLRILLENGADVTVIDEEGNSPMGKLFDYDSLPDEGREQAALLTKYHRDFSVNPVSTKGMSHFHMACILNDLEAVQGFLSHGVDVNHPIDYFAHWRPGHTPLHLASQFRVVELLIDHGADVHAEDVLGFNVLCEAIKRRSLFDESVVEKIIECGADVNGSNFRGQTPFEMAISSGEIAIEKLNFCIKRGFHVNSCNPVTGLGYIAIVVGAYQDYNLRQQVFETIMNENSTSPILGRTTLHHFVTGWPTSDTDYGVFLNKIIKSGCGIDKRDNEGKTALHLAIHFENVQAVQWLLLSGADINIVDKNGNSALSYAHAHSTTKENSIIGSIKYLLIVHACRLVLLKLDISKEYEDAVRNAPQETIRDRANNFNFREEVTRSKEVELDVRSMRLYDFLSETGAVALYPSLKQVERCKIDEYFEVIDDDKSLNEIKGILKLQYGKAVKRLELLPLTTNSFRLLLGFDIPDLCAENIFRYLGNRDLNNIIISAEIGNDDMQMDVD